MIVGENLGRGEAVSDDYVMTSETQPIYADFLPEEHTKAPGRLGMTFAPGMKTVGRRGRWDRNLEADLRALREQYAADVLVSVMEEHEYGGYGIPELFERDTVEGTRSPDGSRPDVRAAQPRCRQLGAYDRWQLSPRLAEAAPRPRYRALQREPSGPPRLPLRSRPRLRALLLVLRSTARSRAGTS